MTRRHSPSEDERRTVKALSGYGVPQEDIAVHIDVDAKTLRKHYRRELDVAAAVFWMKARGGWREKPLPDEEPVDSAPRKIVVSWISPEDVPRSEQYPGGRKVIARDIDHE